VHNSGGISIRVAEDSQNPVWISGLRSFPKTGKGIFEINGSCVPSAGES